MYVDPRAFARAARALGKAAEGRDFRARLVDTVRDALEPVRDEARSNVMGMRSAGLNHAGPPLRRAVAQQTIVEVRQQGALAGARVRAKNRPMPRGFKNAPKRLDSDKGWRHPVFGNREVWARQRGKRGWFSDPVRESQKKIRQSIVDLMADLVRSIAQKAS